GDEVEVLLLHAQVAPAPHVLVAAPAVGPDELHARAGGPEVVARDRGRDPEAAREVDEARGEVDQVQEVHEGGLIAFEDAAEDALDRGLPERVRHATVLEP